jgi:hypothetical protein
MRRLLLAAAIATTAVAFATRTATVLAYPPPATTATVQGQGCSGLLPGKTCQVMFTEVDGDGKPVPGDKVNWSTQGPGSVSPTTSLTDASGVAVGTFTAGPTCGSATVNGTSTKASGLTVISVVCPSGTQAPGGPAAPSTSSPWPLIGAAAGALAVALGMGLLIMRRRGI